MPDPFVSPPLLKHICCPETRQALHEADEETVTRLNERIAAGGVKNAAGARLENPIAAGLVREDGKVLYPVGEPLPSVYIPRLLAEEGVPLAQFDE